MVEWCRLVYLPAASLASFVVLAAASARAFSTDCCMIGWKM